MEKDCLLAPVKEAGIGTCSSWISRDNKLRLIQRLVAAELAKSLVRNLPITRCGCRLLLTQMFSASCGTCSTTYREVQLSRGLLCELQDLFHDRVHTSSLSGSLLALPVIWSINRQLRSRKSERPPAEPEA